MPLARAIASGIAASLLAMSAGAPLAAQDKDTLSVIVRVVDSTGRKLRGAEVQLRDRKGVVVNSGQIDSSGRVRLFIYANTSPTEVFVRRLGYQPRVHALPLPFDETDTVTVVLADIIQTLDTTRVSAAEPLRRRIYYIDSATIAQKRRVYLHDSWDVLKYLRPDIAYGRGFCAGVSNVFINGKWIIPEEMGIDEMVRRREHLPSPMVTPHLSPNSPTAAQIYSLEHHLEILSILASIKPEHISEMTFRTCLDKEIAGRHSRNALFITLAPGIAWDSDRGSFVFDKR